MTEPTSGAGALAQKSDTTPALLGVACGLGAALFWALGFVATRHGLKVGFTPADLLMHRFLWSGLAFLPFVLRAGVGDLCGIGWSRGLALMVLGGPVMSIISYTGSCLYPWGMAASSSLPALPSAAYFSRRSCSGSESRSRDSSAQ